ncbi:hypothetical protein BD410DRAFT_805778 [Rickenella mellea]|uniref:Uncharacterized protein n=1 Tax=Rickenella mellea TaxID=50990 RepID=A0A4Y7PXL6_9AGAM|nr:hypothetical protein BD410DRAFT_805778 [Rickenella mellea]
MALILTYLHRMETLMNEIYERIIDRLDFASVITLSGSSGAHRRRIHGMFMHDYNRLLRAFVIDPDSLRGLMRRTGSIIVGSAPLALIQRIRGTRPFESLEICTAIEFHEPVLRHLMDNEDFTLLKIQNVTDENGYGHSCNAAVSVIATLHGPPRSLPGTNPIVEVFASTESCAILPVLFSHTTVVMNWLGADSLTMLCPLLTLAKRGLINQRYAMDDNNPPALIPAAEATVAKYRAQGYDLQFEPYTWNISHRCTMSAICPHTARSVGDIGTLQLHFGSKAFIDSDVGTSEEDEIIWKLGGGACHGYDYATKGCYCKFVGDKKGPRSIAYPDGTEETV